MILGADSAPDPLFHNESGFTDGNAYAIVVTDGERRSEA